MNQLLNQSPRASSTRRRRLPANHQVAITLRRDGWSSRRSVTTTMIPRRLLRCFVPWIVCATLLIAGCDQPPAAIPADAGDRGSAAVSPADARTDDEGSPRGNPQAVPAEAPPAPAAGPTDPAAKSAPADPSEKPEKRREPLFQGWPKPQLALFITGQQHGYIEP
jgi:hypothetical protein